MIEIKNKSNCCGCHACFNICPADAIEMIEDSEGFKYPKINEEKCIKCNLCNKICPIESKYKNVNNFEKPKIHATYSLDIENKKQSSSGGMFTELAKVILKQNGVVFGAGYDKDMNVISKYVESEEELILLKGSKYVQSNMLDSYKTIKEFLEDGRKVLFVGTPCQVAGLYKFLRKEYKNLCTIDLVCHGVPSPKVYRKYIKEQKEKYKSNINNVNFRDKTKGWNSFSIKLNFENGKTYRRLASKDSFVKGFLMNIYLRPSCYDCNFSTLPRVADISLADFWGVEYKYKEFSDNKGTSLVLINNNKGQALFDQIKQNIYCRENCDLEYAIKTNPCICGSVKEHEIRNEFFKDVDRLNFRQLSKKYIPKEKILHKIYNLAIRILSKIKRLIINLIKK